MRTKFLSYRTLGLKTNSEKLKQNFAYVLFASSLPVNAMVMPRSTNGKNFRN